MGPIEGKAGGVFGAERNQKGWLRIGVIDMEILNCRLELAGMVFFVGATRGSIAMPDETPSASANRELAVEFVAAYVRRNQIGRPTRMFDFDGASRPRQPGKTRSRS